jgi:CRISPR-associated exonuclease Cas4
VERHESRRLFRQEYGMAVRSLERGLIGKCDLVEIYLAPGEIVAQAAPVEFKRGRNKGEDVDRVQLCAQALCLEEMLNITIGAGQLYYLQEHHRTTANLNTEMRAKTMQLIARIRQLQSSGITLPAIKSGNAIDALLWRYACQRVLELEEKRLIVLFAHRFVRQEKIEINDNVQ